MRKKVLVTGARGLVGSAVCRRLLKEGWNVVGLTRSRPNTDVANSEIRWVQGHVTDAERMAELVGQVDVVVHAAADIRIQGVESKELEQTNVLGSLCIADACQQADNRLLIYISSASIFQHGSLQAPGDERQFTADTSDELPYARSKRLATEAIVQRHRDLGLPVVVLAPTFVIGPYDRGPGSGQLLISLYNRKLRFYGSGGKNFVHVDSVADAVSRAIDSGRLGQSYLIGGQNLSYEAFFEECHRQWGRPFRMHAVPDALIRAFGQLGQIWQQTTGMPVAVGRSVARYATMEQYFSIQKAQRELDYDPLPIEQAIAQATEWFNRNGYLNR